MIAIEPGMRVSGQMQGQAFTGTVTTTGGRGGHFALRDGKLITLEAPVLESVTVKTDSPLTMPSGRLVNGAILRGVDEVSALVAL